MYIPVRLETALNSGYFESSRIEDDYRELYVSSKPFQNLISELKSSGIGRVVVTDDVKEFPSVSSRLLKKSLALWIQS